MAPPIREDFDKATLPNNILWVYNSSPEGRIELRGDTDTVITENIPGPLFNPSHYTGSNRMRGNFFQCDQTVELTRQGFYLGRSQSTSVQFLVYESSTANGTYSLISSNTVTASIGTNYVYGTLNTVLKEGKYYLIGAAWNNSARYSTSGSHPQQTAFGQSIGGYAISGYPAAGSASGASPSSLTYVQELDIATNMVMRMDDNLSAGQTATNSVVMVVDIEDYDPLTLSFKHRASGRNSMPATAFS
ncbi:hypothetical protein EGM51_17210 [Verrucomicrobia bacterium S94]|nr:hypothetical protein EGM51_17210 [Verrucomicrobia bacterium S94]